MSKEATAGPRLQPEGIEKRVGRIQFRAAEGEAESRRVEGYASIFNTRSENLGSYDSWFEIVKPGAFANALTKSDVRCLFNHDPNLVLARSKSKTLELREDDKGLLYSFDAPETTFGDDFLKMLRRGDVDQSSFSFSVKRSVWRDIKEADGSITWERTIEEVDTLFDVSPVTYPAYADTTVASRSLEAAKRPVDDGKDDEFYKRQIRIRELEAAQ
jgi:hypothetical protein